MLDEIEKDNLSNKKEDNRHISNKELRKKIIILLILIWIIYLLSFIIKIIEELIECLEI